MKVHLGIALALHALALGAGARWPRAKQAGAPLLTPAMTQEIGVVAAPEAPPPPEEALPLPELPRSPGSAGGGPPRPGPPGHDGGHPQTPGGRVREARPSLSETLVASFGEGPPSTSEAKAPVARGTETSGGEDEREGGSLGGRGDGDGSGGHGSARRRRRGLGERWDAVAGPRDEGVPERAANADERTLPRQTLDAVVARSAGRLRACYQEGVRREPGLAGQIRVRFSVDPGGTVLVASDGGATVADPAVVRCVLSAFAAMTFPARPGGEAVWATHLIAFPPQ